MNRKTRQNLYFVLFRACGAAVVLALVILIGYLVYFGIGTISWDFLTEAPRGGMTRGGIMPQLLGTIYLMVLVLIISVPIGILSAVYLVEYQRSRFMKGVWRVVVHNLAGVPSVVYGLLGLGLFVILLGLGASLIAAALTLSILVLPIIIAATREALMAIPPSLREASIALGATKWQTTRHHVIPYAMPGILTGVILSLSRAAGETAPIILVGRPTMSRNYPRRCYRRSRPCPITYMLWPPRPGPLLPGPTSTARPWCCWPWSSG